jgi:hypothetical protein
MCEKVNGTSRWELKGKEAQALLFQLPCHYGECLRRRPSLPVRLDFIAPMPSWESALGPTSRKKTERDWMNQARPETNRRKNNPTTSPA